MHHYATAVSPTLSDHPAIREIWQVGIPKEAFAHPFLMHGILAMSALHMAHNGADNQAMYRNVAMEHYNVILLTFRPMLSRITAGNCDSLLAASSLIAIIALAFPQTYESSMPLSTIDEIVKISQLGRGIRNLVDSARGWFAHGPFGAFVKMGIMNTSAALPKDESDAIDLLHNENSALEDEKEESKAMFSAVINLLEKAFKAATVSANDPGNAILWIIFIGHEFDDALKRRRPMALIILAHYAVILHEFRQHWWSRSWGYRLVNEVCESLSIEIHHAIQWPLQRVGTCH